MKRGQDDDGRRKEKTMTREEILEGPSAICRNEF